MNNARSRADTIRNDFEKLMDTYSRAISTLIEGLKPGTPQPRRNELIDTFAPLAQRSSQPKDKPNP
jgi:hypothetical protein